MKQLEDNPLLVSFQQLLEECDYDTRPYYGEMSQPCLSVEVYTAAAAMQIGVDLIDAYIQGCSVALNSDDVERLKFHSENICQIVGTADIKASGDRYIVFFLYIPYKEIA